MLRINVENKVMTFTPPSGEEIEIDLLKYIPDMADIDLVMKSRAKRYTIFEEPDFGGFSIIDESKIKDGDDLISALKKTEDYNLILEMLDESTICTCKSRDSANFIRDSIINNPLIREDDIIYLKK